MFESLLKKHLGSFIRLSLAAVSGGGAFAMFATPELLDSVSQNLAVVATTAIISGGGSIYAAMTRNKKIQKLQSVVQKHAPGLKDVFNH